MYALENNKKHLFNYILINLNEEFKLKYHG